ncbi:PD-(D/E)XK nuclease family protein [Variovorax sp. PCZ-1]|uniref:PD-(D/E)XK nuclease family protein n=1 Tax=Variovorax sp. PCZ-1 TaxID=2835533 RepID=UPI001BD1AF9D|nr:PD-(D/E)XK nuclease family protein [Variovorax sp. PCZ-1]MBS7808428.1 PD-(D/E)XK nuclease family protein [Variovorax sp. PCZ-1]
MTFIAKTNSWAELWANVCQAVAQTKAHPARCVVLLPYFQLQALLRQAAQASSTGFLPRIETTKSWQQRIAPFEPDVWDVSLDAGLDSLRSRNWLARSGLAEHQAVLTPLLVETAQQLAALAAAVLPEQRAAWAQGLRGAIAQGNEAGFAVYEAAVARIALEWAAASSYASDALLTKQALAEVEQLIIVRGVQENALTQTLAARWTELSGQEAVWLDLPQAPVGAFSVHTAQDAEDVAQRAAACVLAHIKAGRIPVALPAIDRLATRRISAMLHVRGVSLSDETGWRLSTTRSAASLMSLLRAAMPLSGDDALLDWLKHTRVSEQAVQHLEGLLRGQNHDIAGINEARAAIKFIVDEVTYEPAAVLQTLRSTRPIAAWLWALQQALRISGQWQTLTDDAAGAQMLQALHLNDESSAIVQSDASRMSLSEFSTWVQTALEGASFKPPSPLQEAQVVILPLAQMAARPFGAAVLAGCDAQRLPLAPEPAGMWTRGQREALGLPAREALANEQTDVWAWAMQAPHVDVLFMQAQGDEVLQPSPLLQAWQAKHPWHESDDPREEKSIDAQPVHMPAPSIGEASRLMPRSFSASSYADARACPYRFFALRLLKLSEAKELDEEISKRDFGAWLHAVLGAFHERRPRETDAQKDAELLDACASEESKSLAQDPGFVPFAASWPRLRDSYLLWLSEHEAQGWRFESSETSLELETEDGLKLQGRLDRVDLLAGSGASEHFVMDYKTESSQSLKKRVADPLEDTQLTFYAALLGKEEVNAAYLAVGEKATDLIPQPQVKEAVPMLLAGLADDAQRMRNGHALPAMGEGMACEYCAARGLCRKDFWASS